MLESCLRCLAKREDANTAYDALDGGFKQLRVLKFMGQLSRMCTLFAILNSFWIVRVAPDPLRYVPASLYCG